MTILQTESILITVSIMYIKLHQVYYFCFKLKCKHNVHIVRNMYGTLLYQYITRWHGSKQYKVVNIEFSVECIYYVEICINCHHKYHKGKMSCELKAKIHLLLNVQIVYAYPSARSCSMSRYDPVRNKSHKNKVSCKSNSLKYPLPNIQVVCSKKLKHNANNIPDSIN